MIEFIIRLVILFGVVFGVAYGATRALKGASARRQLAERDEAIERILALKQAYEQGELPQREYDELSLQIYAACRDKGIDLADQDDRPQQLKEG